MDQNTRDVSGDSEVMLLFFGCSKFLVWICNTSDVHTGQTCTINWSKIQLSWVLMLYYPYETIFFRVQISDCFSMCLWFVCKQSDENHLVHGCPFLADIFRRFFRVWWLYLEINHSLVADIICTIYIHSFVQVHNTFQIKTVFNNFLFSTEVHNPFMRTFWH